MNLEWANTSQYKDADTLTSTRSHTGRSSSFLHCPHNATLGASCRRDPRASVSSTGMTAAAMCEPPLTGGELEHVPVSNVLERKDATALWSFGSPSSDSMAAVPMSSDARLRGCMTREEREQHASWQLRAQPLENGLALPYGSLISSEVVLF